MAEFVHLYLGSWACQLIYHRLQSWCPRFRRRNLFQQQETLGDYRSCSNNERAPAAVTADQKEQLVCGRRSKMAKRR